MSGYIKALKIKEGEKDKNNKLKSFLIYEEKLLQKYKKYKAIEDLKNIQLNVLPVNDDRYKNIRR